MADLRLFSYLPNPRLFKATIAARLCRVDLDIRGAPTTELHNWLWDFEARELEESERGADSLYARKALTGFAGTLYKTDAFLKAHPFGTVPAAFSPDGSIGIFESNSIMRAVVRSAKIEHALYGRDIFEASRIDGFLDHSVVFARDAQVYLLALANDELTEDIQMRMEEAFHAYMSGVDQALSTSGGHLAGPDLTIADICFACELALFSGSRLSHLKVERLGFQAIMTGSAITPYPLAFGHFEKLCAQPAFDEDLGPYLKKIDEKLFGAA
jgi:glutathione S-transferase